PAEAAAMGRHEGRGILHEGAQRLAVVLEGNVEAHVDAAVAKVPERLTTHAMALHEVIEVAQVGAQVLRGNRRVLPAGPALLIHVAAAGKARAVRADGP